MDSLFHWGNPKTAHIIDVVCANDPEFGNGKVGEPGHSHNPDAGECYWAYLVGPQIDKALNDGTHDEYPGLPPRQAESPVSGDSG